MTPKQSVNVPCLNLLPALLQMQTPFALPAQTSFESERSQQRFQSASAQDGNDSEFSDEDPSDPEQDATPRRSSRKRNATQASRDADDQVSETLCLNCQDLVAMYLC